MPLLCGAFPWPSAGGVLVISHDEHLVESICEELWVAEPGKVMAFHAPPHHACNPTSLHVCHTSIAGRIPIQDPSARRYLNST